MTASGQHQGMSEQQSPEAEPDTTGAPAAGSTEEAAEDLASANRRRMRAALEHKRGAHHPDDRAGAGGGVRGSTPTASGRDFTRRRSG